MELINLNKLKVGTKLYLMDKEPYVVVEISTRKDIIWLSKLTPGPSEMFFSTIKGLYPFVTDLYGELIEDIKPITKIDKHSFA